MSESRLESLLKRAMLDQVEIFLDIGCGFVDTRGGTSRNPVWVYFWDTDQLVDALEFALDESFGSGASEALKGRFKKEGEKFFPQER